MGWRKLRKLADGGSRMAQIGWTFGFFWSELLVGPPSLFRGGIFENVGTIWAYVLTSGQFGPVRLSKWTDVLAPNALVPIGRIFLP